MEKKKVWEYGGRTFAFDIADSDCVAKLTDALGTLQTAYAELETNAGTIPASVLIERQCGMIRAFFGGIFGTAADGICGERNSLEACTDVYVDFILFVNGQLEWLAQFREAMEARVAARIANLGGQESGAE